VWLVKEEAIWEPLPDDVVRGTDLALRLISRVHALLDGGEHWCSLSLALAADGTPCNPLECDAAFYSLAGAAARARWEMREELAEAEVRPETMRYVMNALFAVAKQYKDEGGWRFASAVLDGIRNALEEFREAQMAEAFL
jgi:hypothetical protein